MIVQVVYSELQDTQAHQPLGENLGPQKGLRMNLSCYPTWVHHPLPQGSQAKGIPQSKGSITGVCISDPRLPNTLFSHTWPSFPDGTLYCFNPNYIKAEGVECGDGLVAFLNKENIRIRIKLTEGEQGKTHGLPSA